MKFINNNNPIIFSFVFGWMIALLIHCIKNQEIKIENIIFCIGFLIFMLLVSKFGYLKLTKEYIKSLNKKNNLDVEFIEYTDNDDNYIKPEQEFSNDWIDIRLYCENENCKQYIKGKEGYNGQFVTENGKVADLRNQCWYCKKHDNERKNKLF